MGDIDYSVAQTSALLTLKSLGAKLAITGIDGTKASTYGAFLATKRSEDAISTAIDARTVLVPGNIKSAPQVGDTLTFKGHDYYVHAVEEENPAGVCLYYKLTVIA
jgi:hypothetical protein